MFENFLQKLKIPDSCFINKKIYKKLFYEKGDIKYSDKKIFISDIEEIIWLYSLKEDTIFIKSYHDNDRDYTEIAILQVLLKKINKYERLADIIQRTIPYPLIIFFTKDNKILINVAHKRINQIEEDKSTYDELIFSKWIDLSKPKPVEEEFIDNVAINNFSYISFYHFYSDFVDRVITLNVSNVKGDYLLQNHDNLYRTKKIVEEIEELEAEEERLKREIKKANQFNQKVNINMQIKKIKNKINKLKDQL